MSGAAEIETNPVGAIDPSRRHAPSDGRPRVVVTGIGLVTGLNRAGSVGTYREATWDALRAGRSAVRVLERDAGDDEPAYPLGCPVPISVEAGGDPVYGLLASTADEAWHDASLTTTPPNFDPDRTATLIGLSKGGIRSLSLVQRHLLGGRLDEPSLAECWERSWPNGGASFVARRYGLRGPSVAPVAACATGLVAMIQGADLIRRGVCDVVLAGSVDASLEPVLLAAFRKMRALAHVSDDPTAAVRPWDRGRSGFVVGEGGAVLVLERLEHATARGVLPYVEVAGGALGADAYHETDLNPDPSGLAAVIRRSLATSEVGPAEVDHVNVHGTATRANDPLECKALRLALGAHAGRIACSANKSQIGHLLGAAGAAELAITCLSIRDGFVPPTLNLDDPDPDCGLDGTPHRGRPLAIRSALKLSIGFGGHLASAVLRRPEGPRRGPGGVA